MELVPLTAPCIALGDFTVHTFPPDTPALATIWTLDLKKLAPARGKGTGHQITIMGG